MLTWTGRLGSFDSEVDIVALSMRGRRYIGLVKE